MQGATQPVRGLPYTDSAEFERDLRVLRDSLIGHHGESLVAPRLAPLIRAAEVFGFHLASIDLRQSSDVHATVLGELLARAGVEADYVALPEVRRQAVLLAELAQPRLLRSEFVEYSELARREFAIFEMARGPSSRESKEISA